MEVPWCAEGDVVVARSPLDPVVIVCKRIVAKHGDLVRDEHFRLAKVPRGHVWLEGDNPADSFDSRRYGSVAEGLVLSKLFYRIWPLHRFGPLQNINRRNEAGEDIDDY